MAGFHDWQEIVEETIKNKTLVEFGLGLGTIFLLEKCKKVKSIEFGKNKDWYERMSKEIDSPKWVSRFYNFEHKWTPQMEETVKKEAQGYEVAFVDSGGSCRPEIVNALFGVVPIIICHDTLVGEEDYHWDRIKLHKDYKREDSGHGQGTSIWRKK